MSVVPTCWLAGNSHKTDETNTSPAGAPILIESQLPSIGLNGVPFSHFTFDRSVRGIIDGDMEWHTITCIYRR